MYRANAELWKCNKDQELRQWDQRIPNEPLFDRTFLIHRPPVIHQQYPSLTNECIESRGDWLLLNPALEKDSGNYWCSHLNGQINQGLPTSKHYCDYSDATVSAENPSPWLTGTNINVDAESSLRRLDYYNPEDCISEKVNKKLHKKNQKASLKLYKGYHQITTHYPSQTDNWFNNFTKIKNLEPTEYDYTEYLKKCHSSK